MKRQKDNRMRFTCPVEGLDYPLYSKEEDKAVRLEDFAYLCLKPEAVSYTHLDVYKRQPR